MVEVLVLYLSRIRCDGQVLSDAIVQLLVRSGQMGFGLHCGLPENAFASKASLTGTTDIVALSRTSTAMN